MTTASAHTNDLIKGLARNRLQGRLCVVIGTGRSGIAAGRLLAECGARVRFADSNPERTEAGLGPMAGKAELVTGKHTPAQFEGAYLVVLSPAVPVLKLKDALRDIPAERIVAETELASWFTSLPSIAITGTNGKTTTVTLVSRIMEEAGIKVFTGGNIGTPLSEFILDGGNADALVLELSSFQLQTCRTYRPDAGLLLNFTPDHLDWHTDMAEYLEAKLSLFARQTPLDLAVLPSDMRTGLEGKFSTAAETVWYAASESNLWDCPGLPGGHNQSNMEAAWQLVKTFGVDRATMEKTLAEFTPPPHRLQNVGEKNGVRFVDDSKATTLDAALAAVRSFDGPVRLLMGGVYKGGDVNEFATAMNGRLVEVGLFGDAREQFEGPLARKAPVSWNERLEGAVRTLWAHAEPGDVILLSPGTASFDQYTSYAERGNDFQRIVGGLE